MKWWRLWFCLAGRMWTSHLSSLIFYSKMEIIDFSSSESNLDAQEGYKIQKKRVGLCFNVGSVR